MLCAFIAISAGLLASGAVASSCKTVPGDANWPSESTWQAFNQQVGGQLINTSPIAISCYPGPNENKTNCANVVNEWAVENFQILNPIGRVLPYNVTCPPVNYTAGETPFESCILGQSPPYAVNATTRAAVNATVQFARQHNIRLVTAGTGHDLLGRSDGFGALELWLRYYRNNITFQQTFQSATGCKSSLWNGSAIVIDGVYQWEDAGAVARANKAIIATGDTPTVGAIGGWSQGGGHGPATTYLGWGVDQVLEAEVLLANGSIVTANACQNPDLYRSLRGGGVGYGVVLSMTVKAYPDVDVVTVHELTMVPLNMTADTPSLLDAISTVVQEVPGLTDRGVGGYAFWYKDYPTEVVNNSTTGYTHGVWLIGQNETVARQDLDPVVAGLQQKYNSTLAIQSSYVTYPDYWSFYFGKEGQEPLEGMTTIMSSRSINRNQVTNYTAVTQAVNTISDAAPGQYAANCILFIGGKTIQEQGNDPYTGFNPGWRNASLGIVTIRVLALNTTEAERAVIDQDMLNKTATMEAFAPGMAAYMNEADRQDPNYIENFYGAFYDDHLATKQKYDPDNQFYCPTCVGSEGWTDNPNGPLCMS